MLVEEMIRRTFLKRVIPSILAALIQDLMTSCNPIDIEGDFQMSPSHEDLHSSHPYPPLYITFVSHNEEPSNNHQGFLDNQEYYLQNREYVRQLASLIKNKGASLNFQSDWNFLMAVNQFDKNEIVVNTKGKNILRWLAEDIGCQIDPHAHETRYNYADIAYLHSILGVQPSKIVGGFLYSPPDNPQGWEKHENGIWGAIYPSYFWKADVLWGAATLFHQGKDDHSYGVWRPKDRFHFTQDDPNQRLIYVGGGCQKDIEYDGNELEGIKRILQAISSHQVPENGFYTATIFIPQEKIDPKMIQAISDDIDWLNAYVNQGRVIWMPLGEIVKTWQTAYEKVPFRIACEDLL